MTDDTKRSTFTSYDAASEVIWVTQPDGLTATFRYDGAGRQISRTDELGNITTTVYDAGGQAIATVDPLGHITTMVYDADGRAVATRTTFTADTATYTYRSSAATKEDELSVLSLGMAA